MICPKVSIVIPTYNRAQKIGALFSSILTQTYRPLELTVVDDGSEDDTFSRLKEAAPLLEENGISTCFRSISHSGQDAAMNEGIKHISGDYFFWCDDDDCLSPDAISSKVEWLQNHPDYDFVRCNAAYVEESSGKTLRKAYLDETLKCEDILVHLLDDTMPPLAGTYMMRTTLLDRLFPGRTIPLNGEGQNLQLLVPAAMFSKCGYIDSIGLRYIIHSDSHSNRSRTLRELLKRNESIRDLKLLMVGPERRDLVALVNATHDGVRQKLLDSAVEKARRTVGTILD